MAEFDQDLRDGFKKLAVWYDQQEDARQAAGDGLPRSLNVESREDLTAPTSVDHVTMQPDSVAISPIRDQSPPAVRAGMSRGLQLAVAAAVLMVAVLVGVLVQVQSPPPSTKLPEPTSRPSPVGTASTGSSTSVASQSGSSSPLRTTSQSPSTPRPSRPNSQPSQPGAAAPTAQAPAVPQAQPTGQATRPAAVQTAATQGAAVNTGQGVGAGTGTGNPAAANQPQATSTQTNTQAPATTTTTSTPATWQSVSVSNSNFESNPGIIGQLLGGSPPGWTGGSGVLGVGWPLYSSSSVVGLSGNTAMYLSGSFVNPAKQTTSTIIRDGGQYRITVALGGRATLAPFGGARISILAGGSAVKSKSVTTAPVSGGFGDVSLTWTATSAEAGKPLGIQIAKIDSGLLSYVDVDNVRLQER